MYQAVFPPPWIPSLTALDALCVCDFLRTEYKSAALVKASPVSRKLAVHRSKQNSVISAFPPSKYTFVPWCLPFHPLILWLYSVFFFFFLATCPGLCKQTGTFNLPYLSAPLTVKTNVSPLHGCRNWNAKTKIHDQHPRQRRDVVGTTVCFPCL